MTKIVLDRLENIVGKGECYLPAFSQFPQCFKSTFFVRDVKGLHCVVKSYLMRKISDYPGLKTAACNKLGINESKFSGPLG